MEPGLEDIIFFKTDDEFADFAIAPFATINEQNGRMVITCGYSTLYEDAVRQGKKFVIMNGSFKSRVNKDGKVAKRVPVKGAARESYTGVTLPVTNYGEVCLFKCEIKYKGALLTPEPVALQEAAKILCEKIPAQSVNSGTVWDYSGFKSLLELIRDYESLKSEFEIIQHLIFFDLYN